MLLEIGQLLASGDPLSTPQHGSSSGGCSSGRRGWQALLRAAGTTKRPKQESSYSSVHEDLPAGAGAAGAGLHADAAVAAAGAGDTGACGLEQQQQQQQQQQRGSGPLSGRQSQWACRWGEETAARAVLCCDLHAVVCCARRLCRTLCCAPC